MRTIKALALAILLAGTASCQFVEPTRSNPNAVPNADVDQLFTTIQLRAWIQMEGIHSRLASIWHHQMAGTARQHGAYAVYNDITEGLMNTEFSVLYVSGGLTDIRKAKVMAEEQGLRPLLGIIKIYEALRFGMAASLWGDLPYSEAARADIDRPQLDSQRSVYDAIQALLTEAMADLAAGPALPARFAAADMSHGGNVANWTAVARTLKARYYMHWAEADPSSYALALAEARQGVQTNAQNWRAIHGTPLSENAIWSQFQAQRSGDVKAGKLLVDLLIARNDPRLPFFFAPTTAGPFVGSAPAEANQSASDLSRVAGGYGSADFAFPILTCAENAFIAAEAAARTGNEVEAQTWLDAGVACERARNTAWAGIAAPPAGLAGDALLEEIAIQKYMALFLNPEVWNDYKRTCRPSDIRPSVAGRLIPARVFYGNAERVSNPNIPAPAAQPIRNANDPNPCPA